MQIFFFDPLGTFILDVFAWILLHLGIGFWSSKIPVDRFDPEQRFFQSFSWEKDGRVYQQLFRVRSWKRFIPQGSKLYRNAFSLQNLPVLDAAYLERWLRESVRAEFCHWMMVVPSFLFFFVERCNDGMDDGRLCSFQQLLPDCIATVQPPPRSPFSGTSPAKFHGG